MGKRLKAGGLEFDRFHPFGRGGCAFCAVGGAFRRISGDGPRVNEIKDRTKDADFAFLRRVHHLGFLQRELVDFRGVRITDVVGPDGVDGDTGVACGKRRTSFRCSPRRHRAA